MHNATRLDENSGKDYGMPKELRCSYRKLGSNQYRVGDIILNKGNWFRITNVNEEDNLEDFPAYIICSELVSGTVGVMLSMLSQNLLIRFIIGMTPPILAIIVSCAIGLMKKIEITARPMTRHEVECSHAVDKTRPKNFGHGRFGLNDGTMLFIPDVLERQRYSAGYYDDIGSYNESCDDSMESNGGNIGTPEAKKRSDRIEVMIDGYRSALATVSTDSTTVDKMGLIADYWNEIMRNSTETELVRYSAEFLEPMKALGDVVDTYIQIRKAKHGFYSMQAIDKCHKSLMEAVDNMIDILRKAGARMSDAPCSKMEASLDYLKLRSSESFG